MTRFPRRLRQAALAASTALALGAPATAAPGAGSASMCPPPMSRLTVTGQGESRVAPDLAMIQLGVTTQAPSAAEAMRQNAAQQAAVIEALTGAGIGQAEIQTSGLNLNPMMDYGEGRAPAVTGYQATNMVAVRVREVARLGEILDAIVGAGANEINGISFTRDDSASAEDEARRAAVEDARHKAEVLAEAAGLTLGPVLVLRDAPGMEGPRPLMMEARAASDAAKVPVAPGEVALSATVEMQFALRGEDCGPMGGHRGMGGMGGGHHGRGGGHHGMGGMDGGGAGHGRHGGHDGRHGGAGALPEGHPPVPGRDPASAPQPDPAPDPAPAARPDAAPDAAAEPAPAADPAGSPAGDLPPPLGTDTGAPGPGEPLVPMGETPPDAPAAGQAPAN